MSTTSTLQEYVSVSEVEFEQELIDFLQNIGGTKQWRYEPTLKTTEQLWENFAQILYQLNQEKLDRPLSVTEFAQVKKVISELVTPYQAGQFLYGLGGISQVEIDTDDGRHVFLTVFDQRQVGAGTTQYQIVNQIQRPAKLTGKKRRIFDTTLLINGLPIIQIEEKSDSHDIDEALNQMEQYIAENQYSDIFSTVQILIALSPVDVRYMANTTLDSFNKAFAFKWQTEKNERVSDWRQFANLFLSIPMAHQMSTSYMILDGTKNKQQLRVMRPYQVYATRKVLDALRKHDFAMSSKDDAKIGYIWHTTGSGKTITSFKTAWLASRLPNVDKVVFLVDRIALTGQTVDNYAAYDPDNDSSTDGFNGVVKDTKHTRDLARQLKSKDAGIVVTSTQKLARLVLGKSFTAPDKNIVFIVDEAHRSTAGDSFKKIQEAFPHAAWVGYTGTPIFDDADTRVQHAKLRTHDIFGAPLHVYTIKHAIADKNVLGFRVEFASTMPRESLADAFLPNFFRKRYPQWSVDQIRRHIEGLSAQEVDDLSAPLYDNKEEHVAEVVKQIFRDWKNRSVNGKYNALLTTHAGGGHASIPMAMMYWHNFEQVNRDHRDWNQDHPQDTLLTLKVAVTFSQDTSNSESQLETNASLAEIIGAYNEEFGTAFTMEDTSAYTANVIERLKRTVLDGNYLDLVIVVDQLLTGFDAPELNTLYVDRTLKSASLIQAYSRTNRITGRDKPFGNIINFRLPALNERLMNEALGIYANENSADVQDVVPGLIADNVLAKSFADQLAETKKIVNQIKDLTKSFVDIPPSEAKQEKLMQLLGRYSSGIDKLKQYPVERDNDDRETAIVNEDGMPTGFDYLHPEQLTQALGMTVEQERMLTTVFRNELRHRLAKAKHVDIDQIELKMTHIKDVEVNYDYLTELVAALINAKHERDQAEQRGDQPGIDNAQRKIVKTKGQIALESAASSNIDFIGKVDRAVEAIILGDYTYPGTYPADSEQTKTVIEQASQISVNRELLDFRNSWGITDVITADDLKGWLKTHKKGENDLDAAGRLADLLKSGAASFRQMATSDRVRALSPIRYRNELRDAFYELADGIIGKL